MLAHSQAYYNSIDSNLCFYLVGPTARQIECVTVLNRWSVLFSIILLKINTYHCLITWKFIFFSCIWTVKTLKIVLFDSLRMDGGKLTRESSDPLDSMPNIFRENLWNYAFFYPTRLVFRAFSVLEVTIVLLLLRFAAFWLYFFWWPYHRPHIES